MKNLTRKLFLSVCTLAICAVTLVSTTFAWYTTNTEVSASGMTGQASATGDASVYISTDNIVWAQSVTLDTSESTALLPCQVTENGEFKLKNNPDGSMGATTGAYLQFDLYVRTSAYTPTEDEEDNDDTLPLYISSITLKNKLTTKPAESSVTDNLLFKTKETLTGGVNKEKQTYWVDIVDALWMNITSSTVANLNKNIYDLSGAGTTTLGTINVTNPNALEYYNTVTKEGLTGGNGATEYAKSTSGTAVKVADLAADGEETLLTFRIFLNGWDESCFDACKGQEFELILAFSTKTDDAVKYAQVQKSE